MVVIQMLLLSISVIFSTKTAEEIFTIQEDQKEVLKSIYYDKIIQVLYENQQGKIELAEEFDENNKNLWYDIIENFIDKTEIVISKDDVFGMLNELNNLLNKEIAFIINSIYNNSFDVYEVVNDRIKHFNSNIEEPHFNIPSLQTIVYKIFIKPERRSKRELFEICKEHIRIQLDCLDCPERKCHYYQKLYEKGNPFKTFHDEFLDIVISFVKKFFQIAISYDNMELMKKVHDKDDYVDYFGVDPECAYRFLEIIRIYRYNSLQLFYEALQYYSLNKEEEIQNCVLL